MNEKAKAKAKTVDDGVRYFRVLKGARYIARAGESALLAEGSVISTLTHDLDVCRAQGIQLERCGPPAVKPPPEVAEMLTTGPAGVSVGIPLEALEDVGLGEGTET